MASILALGGPAPKDYFDRQKFIQDMGIEFVATTIFVYTGTLSVVATGSWEFSEGTGPHVARILPIAISFGVSIMALAFSIGHLSGGHMNPGVSLTMFLKRQMSLFKMISYWLVQFTGALLGSVLMWGSVHALENPNSVALLGHPPPFYLGATTLSNDITIRNGLLLEFMGSFVFYFVIAQTACDTRGIAASSLFPPIPIGFILIVVHICLIPFTGCGVNPARTFGPSILTCMYSSDDDATCQAVMDTDWYWIYYIGPFMASFAVAEVTHWMDMDIDDDDAMVMMDAGVTDGIQEELLAANGRGGKKIINVDTNNERKIINVDTNHERDIVKSKSQSTTSNNNNNQVIIPPVDRKVVNQRAVDRMTKRMQSSVDDNNNNNNDRTPKIDGTTSSDPVTSTRSETTTKSGSKRQKNHKKQKDLEEFSGWIPNKQAGTINTSHMVSADGF